MPCGSARRSSRRITLRCWSCGATVPADSRSPNSSSRSSIFRPHCSRRSRARERTVRASSVWSASPAFTTSSWRRSAMAPCSPWGSVRGRNGFRPIAWRGFSAAIRAPCRHTPSDCRSRFTAPRSAAPSNGAAKDGRRAANDRSIFLAVHGTFTWAWRSAGPGRCWSVASSSLGSMWRSLPACGSSVSSSPQAGARACQR